MIGYRPFVMALCACVLLVVWRPAMAGHLDTQRLRVLISANEQQGADRGDWTYAWALDGQWGQQGRRAGMELTIDSDYSRSETATTDHLLTGWRWIGVRDARADGWKPVFLAQTEGDHRFDTAMLLLAVGMRRKHRDGFIELTAGASRDIGRADEWIGDIGLAFGYERALSRKWTVRTGPQAQYGTMGQLRVRDDRLRYSWDLNLNYRINDACSLGYRLWAGNTVPTARRTQWIGLNVIVK